MVHPDAVDPGCHAPLAWLRIAVAVSPALLAGCVSVRVDGGGGDVRVVRGVGVVRVEVAQPRTAVTGTVDGLGIVQDPLGWSAGFTRQRWALLGRECRAVVWPPPGGLDERTRAALIRTAGVCLLADDTTAADVAAPSGAKP